MMKNCLYFIPAILCFLFAMYMAYNEPTNPSKFTVSKVGHGIASKITFEGHSYVVWQQNWSDCIVHDPDCECNFREAK